MLAFLQRYRELLLVTALLLLPAGTYVANAKQGRELSSLDELCLALSAPISRAVEGTVGFALGLWTSYVDLRDAREENVRLRGALAEANGRLAARIEAELENERLHELLAFSKAMRGRTVAAPVIGVSPTHRRVVTIATSPGDGIAAGMAAVTADGVVGKVVATYGRTAEVQLLVDSASAVAARVQRSRARVTVRGTGEEKRLELANALRTDDIESGDILVTSGTDRVFPKGLVIGRIGRVHREPYGMYLEGEIRPAVDVSGLEEVLVIVSSGEDEDLPTAEVHEEPIPVLPGLP
ncbi:MAG TPA: rod shape-determining protein MreC [Vulgatibacter sp.]|nr:rod shape-determining protein MreC [Vulgatibacter sp.]